jgi:hypothetical protein
VCEGAFAEEVLQHLAGLLHANVEVTLEIHAEVPDGVPVPSCAS